MVGNLSFELQRYAKYRRHLKKILNNTKSAMNDISRSGYFSNGKLYSYYLVYHCIIVSCGIIFQSKIAALIRSVRRARLPFKVEVVLNDDDNMLFVLVFSPSLCSLPLHQHNNLLILSWTFILFFFTYMSLILFCCTDTINDKTKHVKQSK